MLEDKIIGYIKNDVYVITAESGDFSNGKPWAVNVPAFDCGKSDGIYCAGDGCFIDCISGCNETDLLNYISKLERSGYRKFSENSMSGNMFYTYENGKNLVYAYYIKYLNTVKLIAEPFYAYTIYTPEINLVKPAIVASSVCDRNFYVRLPDNTLVVVDGGWRIEDWSLYDHYELFRKMYEEMREILCGADIITVPLWIITHAHNDHARVLERLCKTDIADKFDIKQILFNFPADNHIAPKEAASPEQMAEMKSNLDKWHENAGKDYSYDRIFYNCPFKVYDDYNYAQICREAFAKYNSVLIKAHDGMKFDLSGIKFEVLHTPDDDMPTIYSNFNDTSLVIRMNYKGSPMLWLGDMGTVPSTSCVNMYGDLLKCDAMQVSHHGWGAATPEFYEYAKPSVLFWNNSEFGFKYSDKYQGYGKTKTSTDLYNMACVKKNFFCNRIRMSYAYLPVTFVDSKVVDTDNCKILASAVSDRIYMLALPDKRIVVIDGGWREEDWNNYDHTKLLVGLYKEMTLLSRSETVSVAAWFVTNAKPHNNRFLENYACCDFASSITIEKIIYNFVPSDNLKGGYNFGNITDYDKLLLEEFKKTNAELVVAKSGMNFKISGADFDILHAPNEFESYDSLSDTSLIIRFRYKSEKIIFTGDMTDALSEKMLAVYGNKLKCEAVQVANHGWSNCGLVDFYKTCGAKLQLWNNSEYGFQFFRKYEGYRKTKSSTEIYKLPSCKLNVFCDQVKPQIFSFPLCDAQLRYDV